MSNKSGAARAFLGDTSGMGGVGQPLQGLRAKGELLPFHGQQAPASRIDANVPAGVHDQSMNALAPFLGNHALPTGQQINVSMNAPSPHLPFKEWVLRGIVGGIGHLAAWPFRLIGGLVDHLARTIINVLGKLVMFVLLPAALVVGCQMAMKLRNSKSVEAGTTQMMHDSRHAAHGAMRGLTDDLPAEQPGSADDGDGNSPARSHHARHAR